MEEIERVSSSLSTEEFINLGFEKKWYGHLWIHNNNKCFLSTLENQVDLKKLYLFLQDQLEKYIKKLKNNTESSQDWLDHTIFICKNEYTSKGLEVFREVIKWCKKQSLVVKNKDNSRTFPAKYYALFHWVKIEMGLERDFERNQKDQYIKSEIENYTKVKYKGVSPQGFYKSFIDIDITNKVTIAKSFGNGYKEKLIKISNKDAKLISHLKSYPN